MSWFTQLDHPTSISVVSVVLSFILILFYLSYNRPDCVMDKSNPVDPKISYRLLLVYTLLWSSTMGLFVFCAIYLANMLKTKKIL